MQFCDNCKVSLKGNNKICPLCGGIVQKQEEDEPEVFPFVPTIYQEFNLLIRTMLMVSISAIIVSFAVNLIFTKSSNWSLFVAGAILCMWVSLYFVIRKRHNVPKTIVWQVVLLTAISVIWDFSMGWRGWSINFVLPIACAAAMVVIPIAHRILKIGVRDLLIYIFMDAIFGFIPMIFLALGLLQVIVPSIICAAFSAISLTAIVLYEGDNLKSELKKRMHI
ncbi:MAG TPA: hypothetical protein GXX75_07375 [Clostridiales bacterium]|nr:hypothetical protein [Clostridiales bacterium]